MEPLPRPTQRPLDREEQKRQFEALQNRYAPPPDTIPVFPIQPLVPEKPIEEIQLKSFRDMLKERGMNDTVQKVEKQIEEKKTVDTVKQFYCTHKYTPVRANYMGLPIRYKICSKCGSVK
jgi:hypothetical protein